MMRSSFNTFQRPGLIPPSPELPAEAAAIKDAITYQNANAVQEKLNKTNLSPETWQALLAHAFKQESSSAIKEALLQHPDWAPQAALELAVQHNDIFIATQALPKGANPDHIKATPNTDAMRALLTRARRKNILYPPNTPHSHETALDHALRNVLNDRFREDADKRLSKAIDGKKLPEAWRDAVKKNRLDIQRAILLLRADQDRHFRLLEEDPVTDKAVAKVLKEIPYFSPKRGLPENFNSKAMFSGKNEEIVCRHLAEHQQAVQERSGQLKFDYAQYMSSAHIAAHVSYNTEAKFMHITAHAEEAHLFHNNDFGNRLVQQLDVMASKGETSRLIMLLSTNHAMSMGLKIKKKDGKPHYVAEFFDPNLTTSHVRVASDSLHAFKTLTLENFIDTTKNRYQIYYPEPDGPSVMFVRPSPQEEQAIANPVPGAVENRRLTSCIEDEKINASAFFHMLAYGFAGDLRRLESEIATRHEEERVRLLAVKNTNGTPGLFLALQYGHADVIKVFGKLLKLVPPEDRAMLLAAKDADGTPGLCMALQYGHADTIRAFGELLKLVPPKERAMLLAAKDANGTPGLHLALENGHADAIKAFGELLESAPPAERVELLAAKRTSDGISGLAVALKKGNLEALDQYIEVVKKTAPALSAQERAALLKHIRKSHAAHIRGIWWDNYPYYLTLKTENPAFYSRFKKMKKLLKS